MSTTIVRARLLAAAVAGGLAAAMLAGCAGPAAARGAAAGVGGRPVVNSMAETASWRDALAFLSKLS
jgi:hypothetical protein